MRHCRITATILATCIAAIVPMNGCSSRQDGRKPDAGPGGGPGSTGDTPGPDTPTPPDANADALVDLAKVVNLDRFPGLTEEHRRRLAEDGFFVVPSTALAPFQLYERNERLGLPSYVTPELVVDAYRAVLASVERDVELSFAAPALHRALAGLVQRGIELRRFSLGDRRDDIEALDRAIAVFAVAARLLSAGELRSALPTDGEGRVEGEEAEAHAEVGRVPLLVPLDDLPSPTLPAPADAMFQEAMSRIRAADGVYATVVLEREADFRVFGVAERAEPGRAQALVRTLVWLDLACPAAAGDLADNLTGSLVLRLLADAESSGEPVRDLWRRATLLLSATGRVLAGTEPLPAVEAFRAQVADGGTLPPSAGASIRAVLAVPGTPPRGTLGLIGGRIDPSACAGCDDDLLWIGPAAPTGAVWAALQDEAATSDGAAAAERVHPASWAGIVESWNGWSARVLRRRPELPAAFRRTAFPAAPSRFAVRSRPPVSCCSGSFGPSPHCRACSAVCACCPSRKSRCPPGRTRRWPTASRNCSEPSIDSRASRPTSWRPTPRDADGHPSRSGPWRASAAGPNRSSATPGRSTRSCLPTRGGPRSTPRGTSTAWAAWTSSTS